jgi:chromosomal replication initiation ATPase DnaA
MKDEARAQQLVLDLPIETALGEADFVVAAGNRQAYEFLLGDAEWPSNVCILWGEPKSGKTHLGGIWASQMQAERASVANWPEVLSSHLLVENADSLWMGETALFNLLNQAMREPYRVLLTAQVHPNLWRLKTNDVRSRLRLAHNIEIAALDDAHLMQLLVKLFDDRQVKIDPAIVSYVMPRIERSPSFVVQLVERMDALALSRGKPITKRLAGEAIDELLGLG